jgi:hypothetical protein
VAREHQTRPYVVPPQDRSSEPDEPRFTPAELHAMRRSAPLTPTQYEELRRLAEQGANPLRRL